uniref:C2H2-type domain-containing protein n=1 Tax=Homalodisca liturata TaxID=320908 RepID=A0A1B6IVV3_9HEMI
MPRTKKPFRRLKSTTSSSEIKISVLNGEPYQPTFNGWATESVTFDKLLRFKKQVKRIEIEVETAEDVINEVKSCFELFEKAALEMKLKDMINSFPSFTEDLIEAAIFISEFSYDSDDEISDTSIDDIANRSTGKNDLEFNKNNFSDCENIHSNGSWSHEPCENLEERHDGSFVEELESIGSSVHDLIKTNYDDEKLHQWPVVVLSSLNVLNTNKNSEDETNITQNSCCVEEELEKSSVHTQSPDNFSENMKSEEEENLTLVWEKSDEEQHCENEVECRSRINNDIMLSTPIVRSKRTKLKPNLIDDIKIHSKNVKNRSLKERKINSRKTLDCVKQSVTIVKKLNSEIKVLDNSETKKHEETIDTFLDAVSEVTNVSQILSLVKRKFICMYCKFSFIQKGTLAKHLKICSMRDDRLNCRKKKKKTEGDESCICKLCGAWLKFKKSVPRHNEMVHNLVRSHICVVCNWGFYNERSLQHHVMSRHGLSLTEHMKCPYCDCAFRRRDDLRTHCRKHKAPYFLCSICFKTFSDESLWKAHEQDHGFMCDVCDFFTRDKEEIATHKLTHLQLITYKCDVCSKLFNKKRFVTRHMKQVHMKQQC